MSVFVGLFTALTFAFGLIAAAHAGETIRVFVSDQSDGGAFRLARSLVAALPQVDGIDVAHAEGALAHRALSPNDALHDLAGMSDVLIVRSASEHFRLPRDDEADMWRRAHPIAALSADTLAVAVRWDSRVEDFPRLLSWIREHPKRFAVAGASPRLGLDHLILGLILREAGLDLNAARYLPCKDAEAAITRLLAGEAGIVIGPYDDLTAAERRGHARVLATTAPAGTEDDDGKPSLRALGFEVEFEDWRAVELPPRTPAEFADRSREIVARVADTPVWRDEVELGRVRERLIGETRLAALIDEQDRMLESVRRQLAPR